MSSQLELLDKGDWIVHARYGVGQVKGIEKKELEGENFSGSRPQYEPHH